MGSTTGKYDDSAGPATTTTTAILPCNTHTAQPVVTQLLPGLVLEPRVGLIMRWVRTLGRHMLLRRRLPHLLGGRHALHLVQGLLALLEEKAGLAVRVRREPLVGWQFAGVQRHPLDRKKNSKRHVQSASH